MLLQPASRRTGQADKGLADEVPLSLAECKRGSHEEAPAKRCLQRKARRLGSGAIILNRCGILDVCNRTVANLRRRRE